MAEVDWSVLSGPRVSRRTLIQVAAASGAGGFAAALAARARTAAAGAAAPARQEPKPGGTLRLGLQIDEIATLDPNLVSHGFVAGSMLPMLFSSLVQFDVNLALIPDLAETWEVTPDGLQYTFHLRPGLTFHNGDTLTSADVLYTYQRVIDPAVASGHAHKLALITEVTTPDELTVVITFSAPFAPFLAVACSRGPGRALTPVPRRVIEELGPEQFGITPVGSGPFMMLPETAEPGRGFELARFDGWHGGRPLLDGIVARLIPESSSLVSALEAGDVDLLDPAPPVLVQQLRENPDVTVVEAPSTGWRGLVMNYNRPPWDNLDARMAVSKAIDRQDFVDTAFFGLAIPSVGPIAPAFGWVYQPPEAVENPQGYNLEEAKTLAEKAGLTGLKPKVMSFVEVERPTEVLRNALQDIGLDLQIEFLQAPTFHERLAVADYDMAIHGSAVDADPDDGNWTYWHSAQQGASVYGYANPRTDELLEATRHSPDQAERARLFQELQSVLEADVAAAYLYHPLDVLAYYTYVQGYVPIPEQRYYETVWLDQ